MTLRWFPPTGYVWRAERDGVGHLVKTRGRAIGALCGERAPDERWASPINRYCMDCYRQSREVPMT